jgi:transcriptional regulator with XRE-family HTH domain
MEHFGTRLKRFREARGWTQEQLALELDVSKATISKWESGHTEPRLSNLLQLHALCVRMGLDINDLTQKSDASFVIHDASFKTQSSDESLLLQRYRALNATRKKGLIALLSE